MKAKRAPKPTIYQTKVLAQICGSSYRPSRNGVTQPLRMSAFAVSSGTVRPFCSDQRTPSSLSVFINGEAATYVALKAPGLGLTDAPLHRR